VSATETGAGSPKSWEKIVKILESDIKGPKPTPVIIPKTVTSAYYGSTAWNNPLNYTPQQLVAYWGMECTSYSALADDDGVYWQTYVYPPAHWQMYHFSGVSGNPTHVDFTAQYTEWWDLYLYTWDTDHWQFLYNVSGDTDPFWVNVTNRIDDGYLTVLCFAPGLNEGSTITIDYANLWIEYP
jgi:hypothetical protein